jgi:hypothetical protein
MTYPQSFDKTNIMGVTSAAETAYPSGASDFTPVFLSHNIASSTPCHEWGWNSQL